MISELQSSGQSEIGNRKSEIHSLFSVPNDQEFFQLPHDVRKEVRTWLALLKEIASAPKLKPACKYHAARLRGMRGFSEHNIRRAYYRFIKSGHDWHTLIDWAKVGASRSTLPAEFVQFWKKLVEENQRCDAAAWRTLKEIWRTRHTAEGKRVAQIPGYKDWPTADPSTGLPVGWTYSTLARHTSTKQEKAIARVGPIAASVHRRKVLTSRAGLRVGQYIEFDDQVYDQKVNFLARRQTRAMRPLGLNALDLLSACCFSYSFKPTLWNPEKEAKEQLKESDMLWFVANLLLTHGYRTDDLGTTLIVEHGTAAIREAFEKRIFDATGGKVRIDRSGIMGDAACPGMFEGARRGNFRFKAAIESFFNLVRNETAMLPGQVGKDRDHSPEQMVGLERYNAQTLQLAQRLSPEEAAQLKFPVLEWNQWVQRVIGIYDAINKRTEHDLEGWRKLNFTTSEWRLDPSHDWFHMERFLALPEPNQLAVRAVLDADPLLTRVRQLSPWEVWQRGKSELTPLQSFQLVDLLGPEAGVERTVDQGVIAFDDIEITPETIIFDALLDGQSLPNGSKYLTFVNPFNMAAGMILCDARACYIGTIPLSTRPCRSDYAAIKREMGKARKAEADALRAVGLRHTDQAEAKTEMHRHNTAVVERHLADKENLVASAKAALSKTNTHINQEESDI